MYVTDLVKLKLIFCRYRWAFVGSQYDNISSDIMNGSHTDDMQFSSSTSPLFIPHVRRIARLMDLRFTSHSPVSLNVHIFR